MALHGLLQIMDKDIKGDRSWSDPWGFLTSLQVERNLLTATLLCFIIQLIFTYLVAHPSRPWPPHLDVRTLWDTVLKALLKLG